MRVFAWMIAFTTLLGAAPLAAGQEANAPPTSATTEDSATAFAVEEEAADVVVVTARPTPFGFVRDYLTTNEACPMQRHAYDGGPPIGFACALVFYRTTAADGTTGVAIVPVVRVLFGPDGSGDIWTLNERADLVTEVEPVDLLDRPTDKRGTSYYYAGVIGLAGREELCKKVTEKQCPPEEWFDFRKSKPLPGGKTFSISPEVRRKAWPIVDEEATSATREGSYTAQALGRPPS